MAAWIAAIPFSEWPQQRPIDSQLRPMMVTDLEWHGFGEMAAPVIKELGFEGQAYQLMLSVVMPGHSIDAHIDEQAPYWHTRIHVPLLSNDRALFISEGKPIVMTPGLAYRVNTRALHAIENGGTTPRVHFMFDVRGSE